MSTQEAEIQRLERLLQEQEQRAEKAERRIRETTFEEYLSACHTNLHKGLSIQTDKSSTTQGFTNPRNKYFPPTLRCWDDFPALQLQQFEKAYEFFHPPHQAPSRSFQPVIFLEQLGQGLSQRKLAGEADLATYQRTAVEDMVTHIINQLCKIELARTHFRLEQGIAFDNHPNSLDHVAEESIHLDDAAEDVQNLHIRTPRARPQPLSSSSSSSSSNPKPSRTRADQFCVYKNINDVRQLLLVVEYKPPHKLSASSLRAGLSSTNIGDLLTAATEPIEEKAVQQNKTEKLIAAVMTQTFHYMIENGLEFSYIVTGEAFVFLRVEEAVPTTLFYHLTVPSDEIDEDRLQSLISMTAIGQVMSFCLMAFQSKARNHRWRRNAKKRLSKYHVDYKAILERIPESERKCSPPSAFKGRKGENLKTSPYQTRSRTKQDQEMRKGRLKTPTTCDPRKYRRNYENDDDKTTDDDDSDFNTSSHQTAAKSAKDNKTKEKNQSTNQSQESNTHNFNTETKRQYCTQQCLLGLVRGWAVDEKCPNASSHPRSGNRHAIKILKLQQLLQKQLGNELDYDCEPLGLQGARGALFRLVLTSHAYVFVGKGTVKWYVRALLHEGAVYKRLETLQGIAVPVYLGNIDLLEKYYLAVGVKIRHMLLLSWGGHMIGWENYGEDVRRTVQEVTEAGVAQSDVRDPNLLWNEERKRVMLIDFERARYIEPVKGVSTTVEAAGALQDISPNKKQKRRPPPKLKEGRRMQFE